MHFQNGSLLIKMNPTRLRFVVANMRNDVRGIALSILFAGFAHIVLYKQAHGGARSKVETWIVIALFISAIGCIVFGI